ncbi:MAG: hypothetical protein ACKVXR_18030 [Planctomycetota bacterium]
MRILLSIAFLSLLLQDPAPTSDTPPPDAKYGALVAEIGACASIEDGFRRLEAFDALARRLGVGRKPVEGMGRWAVKTSVNPLDDSQTVLASLEADTESTIRLKGGLLPQLVVRCKRGELEIYTITGTMAEKEGKEGKSTVTLRFDKQAAFDVRMDQSAEGDALFWPDAAESAKRMLGAERLLVVFTPANEKPALMQFDLRGFAVVHEQLLEACPGLK